MLATRSAQAPVACATPRTTVRFADLYDEHFAFVWRSARRLGTPQASIDDVVQEVFVVVHRRLSEFEGRSAVRTWLFGIVINVVRAHRRSLRARHPHALSPEAAADPESLADRSGSPQDAAMRAQATRLLDRLLGELDDDKRTVLVLAELEQMSAPEIAQMLEVPLNTVYSRLRLAREEFAAAAARYRARDEWRTR
jgi:RNA polymerase sigma-70 factor (ECF subfamily)